MDYQRFFDTVPAYSYAVFKEGVPMPSGVKWANSNPPPAIGSVVNVTSKMNGLGPATVTGYFVEHNWLGLLCRLHNPPDWWKRQSKDDPNRLVHIFGLEYS